MIEAARIVEEGIADIEDVDKACKLGFGHAMGPLLTADLSGLDTRREGGGQPARRTTASASSCRRRCARSSNAGHLGRKTGRGLRDYGEAR